MASRIKNRYVLLPAFLLGSFLVSCAYFNTFYNAETAYQNGYEAMRQEERDRRSATSETNQYFREAVNKGRKILEQYGDSKYVDDAYLIMGKSYYYLEQYTAARDQLLEMLDKFPQSPLANEGRLFLGKAYLAIEDYILARHTLEQLVESSAPEEIRAQAYLALADLNQAEGNSQEMLTAINQAISVSDDREIKADAAWRTAQWAVEEGRFDDAEKYYREASKFTRKPQFDRKIDFEMTQLFRKSGAFEPARKQLSLMLADENFQELWPDLEVERGLLSAMTGDTASAVEAYKYVTANYRNTPAAAHAFYLLGETSFDARDYSGARGSYQQVARADRTSEYVDSARVKIQTITTLEGLQRTRNKVAKQILATGQAESRSSAEPQLARREPARDRPGREPVSPGTAGQAEPDRFGELSKVKQTGADRIFTMATRGDSLPTEFQQYVETLYQMAEIYMFDLEQPELGLAMSDTVARIAPEKEFVAKTLLLRWFCFKHVLREDSQAASLRRTLLQEYAETEAGRSLTAETTGQPMTEAAGGHSNPAQLYHQADSLITAHRYQSALVLLHRIHRDFPETRFGAKALYARGWLFENRLMQLDSALADYQRFQTQYPDHALTDPVTDRIKQLQSIRSALASSADNAGPAKTENEQSARPQAPAVRNKAGEPEPSASKPILRR